MNLRERLNDAPVVTVAIVMAILFGGFTLLLNITTGLAQLSWASVIGAAIGGLVFGILMAATIRFQRHRAGGVATARSVTNAIKSGTLPENATADEWRPLLERRRRQGRLLRWLGPVEFGAFALLSIYLLFTDTARVVFWSFAVLFFLSLAVTYPISTARQLPKIEALEEQLAHS